MTNVFWEIIPKRVRPVTSRVVGVKSGRDGVVVNVRQEWLDVRQKICRMSNMRTQR